MRIALATAYAVLSALITGPALHAVDNQAVEKPREHWIGLKSRTFTPDPGVDPALLAGWNGTSSGRRHVLVQFWNPVTQEEAEGKLAGVAGDVVAYIPNDSWIVAADRRVLALDLASRGIRWIGPLEARDRIDPALLSPGKLPSLQAGGTERFIVDFFRDVSDVEQEAAVRRAGLPVIGLTKNDRTWTADLTRAMLDNLLDRDEVQWIDLQAGPALSKLDGLRANMRVDEVQGAPFGLSGTGVVGGVWEGGSPDTTSVAGGSAGAGHDDYLAAGVAPSRVTVVDAVAVNDHATLVTGIFLGSGFSSNKYGNGGAANQWKGVAPAATARTFKILDPDSTGSTADAFNAGGSAIALSNNSWGRAVCRCVGGADAGDKCNRNTDCDLNNCTARSGSFSAYSDESPDYDRVVRGERTADKKLKGPVVFAAGNEGACGLPVGQRWETIDTGGATAKNTITVGNIYSDTNGMRESSSSGPTDDGRVKPDVVAPGCEAGGDGGIKGPTDNPVDSYAAECGTSMAAPAVSGTIALLIQDWRTRNGGATPSPAILKALLICGARDLGAAGPNYDFGYGAVDARESLRLSRKGAVLGAVRPQVKTDEDVKLTLTLPAGVTKVRTTLVWDDPAGANNANPSLVNDLDFSLIAPDGVTTTRPWRLDKANPGDDATKGLDSRNNVEQVEEANPAAGNWTVKIRGFAVPMASPQIFAVCTKVDGAKAAWKFNGNCTGAGNLTVTVAGQAITVPLANGNTANDVAAAVAAAVNADGTLAALGIAAAAAGDTVTINGILQQQIPTAAVSCPGGLSSSLITEVTGLKHTNKTTLAWDASLGGGGTVHDVVRGLVHELPVGSGAGETCLGSPGGTTIVDNENPPAGRSFWYLVRGRNALGTGTYGFTTRGEERVTTKCP